MDETRDSSDEQPPLSAANHFQDFWRTLELLEPSSSSLLMEVPNDAVEEILTASHFRHRQTPIQFALANRGSHPNLIQVLATACPQALLMEDSHGYTALYSLLNSTAEQLPLLTLVEILADACPQALTLAETHSGNTPLHLACERHSSQVIRLLAKKGPEAATRILNSLGCTPLHSLLLSSCADAWRTLEDVQLLAELYPEAAKVVDVEGMLPLHICYGRNEGTLDYVQVPLEVIEYIANLNPEAAREGTMLQETPLHIACQSASQISLEAMQFLVEFCPAAVRCLDIDGYTPLLHFCLDGYEVSPDIAAKLRLVGDEWPVAFLLRGSSSDNEQLPCTSLPPVLKLDYDYVMSSTRLCCIALMDTLKHATTNCPSKIRSYIIAKQSCCKLQDKKDFWELLNNDKLQELLRDARYQDLISTFLWMNQHGRRKQSLESPHDKRKAIKVLESMLLLLEEEAPALKNCCCSPLDGLYVALRENPITCCRRGAVGP